MTIEKLTEQWNAIEPYDDEAMLDFATSHVALLLACAEILKAITQGQFCNSPSCDCGPPKIETARIAIGNLEAEELI